MTPILFGTRVAPRRLGRKNDGVRFGGVAVESLGADFDKLAGGEKMYR
jgi:hypothetical protein